MQSLSQALLYNNEEVEARFLKELELLKLNSDNLPYSISYLLEWQDEIGLSIYDYTFLDELWIALNNEFSQETCEDLEWIKKLIDEIIFN